MRSTVSQLNGHMEAASMGSETEFAVTFQPTVFTVIDGGIQFVMLADGQALVR